MSILLVILAQAKGPYQAPDREPTPEETLVLELLNRFRANPTAEAQLLLPEKKTGSVDWAMFVDEMKQLKPAPPLVFNLDLLDSARKHSYYMTINGLGHVEEAGKAGFTGVNPGDRVKLSGYKGMGGGEDAFAAAPDAAGSHFGFVVDIGAGPGGMQPGRGHRMNMIGRHKEIGPGAVPSGTRLSVTHNFGTRNVRMAGGVIHFDYNGNKFYDVGEGIGGVAISASDGTSSVTWKSGAYSLDLKGQGEITLTVAIEGEKLTKTFPAGPDNVKFDWIVPQDVFYKKADKHLAAVESAKGPKQAQALVNLAVNTQGIRLDAERRKKIDELTAETSAALLAAQNAVLEALPAETFRKVLDEQRKPYRGTDADAWFQDAEVIAKLGRIVSNFEKSSAAQKPAPPQKAQLVSAIQAEGSKIKTPRFKSDLSSLVSRITGL